MHGHNNNANFGYGDEEMIILKDDTEEMPSWISYNCVLASCLCMCVIFMVGSIASMAMVQEELYLISDMQRDVILLTYETEKDYNYFDFEKKYRGGIYSEKHIVEMNKEFDSV